MRTEPGTTSAMLVGRSSESRPGFGRHCASGETSLPGSGHIERISGERPSGRHSQYVADAITTARVRYLKAGPGGPCGAPDDDHAA